MAFLKKIFRKKKKIKKNQHSDAMHHFHVRKRVHHYLEDYPHPDNIKQFIDRCIYYVGVLGPIATLPQLWNIWVEKEAGGVSVYTFSAYLFISCFWFIYGVLHEEKPIVFIYTFCILVQSFVVAGIFLYG